MLVGTLAGGELGKNPEELLSAVIGIRGRLGGLAAIDELVDATMADQSAEEKGAE